MPKLAPVIIRNVHDKFKALYHPPEGTELIICIGGRGGMKTYNVSKFAAVDATIRGRRVAVLRDEKEAIRESILNEIFARYDSANKYGHFDGVFEKLETGIRNKHTGSMCVFTKGFRASSNEKRSNLKGVSDTDTAIVEEAEDIRSFEKFNTFRDSIRTKERLIIVILNTPDIQHWIVKRYFNLEVVESVVLPNGETTKVDGYWKLVPKTIPGFHCIQTSFDDNEHLPAGVIRDYNAYGDPGSATYDLHYYLTAILGLASSGRKGQIIKKAKPISARDYYNLELKEITGLDFGTSSPAGIAGVKMDGDNLYAITKNYLPLPSIEIGKLFCQWQYTANDLIIADSADPIAIGKLRRGWPASELNSETQAQFPGLMRGFNVRGAVKGTGSLEAGLSMLTGMNLYFVDDAPIDPKLGLTPIWHEVFNYIYAVNKEGEYTNIPIDDFNHIIDPIRYVAQSRGRFF